MKIDCTIQMLDIPLRFFSSFCAFTSAILAVRVVLFSFIYKHPSTVNSIVDPWHFGKDPDPRLWPMDPDPPIFVLDLQDANRKYFFSA